MPNARDKRGSVNRFIAVQKLLKREYTREEKGKREKKEKERERERKKRASRQIGRRLLSVIKRATGTRRSRAVDLYFIYAPREYSARDNPGREAD